MNAVSIPYGVNDMRWVENEWEWLERFKTIYLCMDNDKAGRDAVRTIVNKLGAWRCRAVVLPYKDANECLMKGIDLADIISCFENAVEFSPSLLTTAGAFEDEVIELFKDPERLNGTPTFLPKLTRILRGWRTPEVTVWSGRNSSGKSTALNQCILHLAKEHNTRACIASLELPPRRYLRWAVMQHLQTEYPSTQEVKEAMAWMNKYMYVVNTSESIKPDDLLDVFEYAARRYNVKHFVIDSLMRIRFPNINELEEQKTFVSDLGSFAKKHDVHPHLVAHPRKGVSDKEKPGKVDISGSGHITDLADNVIMLWRPDEDEKADLRSRNKLVSDAIMYVKKNREFGDEGGIKLYFDSKTKTFREEE